MPSPLEVLRGYPAHDGGVWGLLGSRAQARPDHPALIFGEREWRYAGLVARAEQAAAALVRHGIGSGDRVALMADNDDRFLMLFLALARLGAVLVTVNPRFGVDEAAYVIGHCDPRLATGDAASMPVLLEACGSAGITAPVLDLDDALDDGTNTAIALPPMPSPETTGVIMYTSGTTGFPKGVMHAQRSFVLAGEGFVERSRLVPEDRMLCILPLFHLNALFYSFGGALAAGATLVLAPRFSARRFWPLVEEQGITQVNIIAAIGSILARRPEEEFRAGHRLSRVYGAPVSPELAEVFHGRFGVERILEGYGMTEIPGAASMPFEGPHRYGSMGRPARHPDPEIDFARIRIVDEHGVEVPEGQVGEMLVHTPIVMQGYFRDPEATGAALRDGWFRTGDRGLRDDEGVLWFKGRQKDLIRRRGENISGAELDRVVGALPGVSEAAAIAVPSALGEDDILVAVVAEPGATLEAESIALGCARQLSPAKVPRYVVFLESLPLTATHRVAKYRLAGDAELLARAVDLEAGSC